MAILTDRVCRSRGSLARALALGFVLTCCTGTAFAETAAISEYEVKAIFLLNFTRFVEWPSSAQPERKPLVVAVLGNDPFGRLLDDAVRGETVNGRPLVVKRVRELAEAEQCEALFIASSEKSSLARILRQLEGKPILTVSDIPQFAEAGGMVGLVAAGGRTKLQINVDATKAAKLSISAKLLRPAEIVTTRKTSLRDFIMGHDLLAGMPTDLTCRSAL